MDQQRITRVTKARAIVNHSSFKAFSDEKKTAALRIMLDKGLLLEDLQTLANEQIRRGGQSTFDINSFYSGKSFNILDKGVLTKILLTSTPRQVLQTCKVNRQFAAVCDDRQVFLRLFQEHYPGFRRTDHPRRQYAALTEGIETTYRLLKNLKKKNGITVVTLEDPVMVGKPSRPEDIPGWSITNFEYFSHGILYFIDSDVFKKWMNKSRGNEQMGAQIKTQVIQIVNMIQEGLGRDRIFKETTFPLRNPEDRKHIMLNADEEIEGPLNVIDFLNKLYTKLLREARLSPDFKPMTDFYDFIHNARPDEYRSDFENENGGTIIFTIPGIPVPVGKKFWMYIWNATRLDNEDRVSDFYETKEEMAKAFVDQHYESLLDALIDPMYRDTIEDEDIEDMDDRSLESYVNDPAFNDFLKGAGIEPRPFTKEKLYEYVMTHSQFNLDPENNESDHFFLFPHLTF